MPFAMKFMEIETATRNDGKLYWMGTESIATGHLRTFQRVVPIFLTCSKPDNLSTRVIGFNVPILTKRHHSDQTWLHTCSSRTFKQTPMYDNKFTAGWKKTCIDHIYIPKSFWWPVIFSTWNKLYLDLKWRTFHLTYNHVF